MTSNRMAPGLAASTQSSDSIIRGSTDGPNHEICPLDAANAVSRNESSDGSGRVVAILNPKWRVIECRDQIQWILQSRESVKSEPGLWRGRSYCRTKEALLRVCAFHASDINPIAADVLAALPTTAGVGGRRQRLSSKGRTNTE
jgi:hypothetical protein